MALFQYQGTACPSHTARLSQPHLCAGQFSEAAPSSQSPILTWLPAAGAMRTGTLTSRCTASPVPQLCWEHRPQHQLMVWLATNV